MPRTAVLSVLAALACNQPPGAPEIRLGPEGARTADDLVLELIAPAVDPNGRDVVEHVVRWSLDGTARPELDDAWDVPAAETARGQRWEARVVATDGELDGEVAIASLSIQNTPPTATASLTPHAPASTEALSLSAAGSDEDGDEVELEVQWLVDGVEVRDDGWEIDADRTRRGERWTARVTPRDEEGPGDPVEVSVDVANAPPRVLSVSIFPGQPREGDTATARVEATDPDDDELELRYTWFIDSVEYTAGERRQLTGADFDKGQVLRVEVVAFDGFVASAPVASGAATIENTPPTLETATLTPTEVYEATELACVPGGFADVDGDPEGVLTSWYVDGALAGTSPTLTGRRFDKGDRVSCILTPFDGEDPGDAVESTDVFVRNTAPVLASASLDPARPREGDTITVVPGTAEDADGDDVTFRIEWLVNGKLVSKAQDLPDTMFAKGDEIVADVTPFDGSTLGATVRTPVIEVENSPPVVTKVTLSPASPRTDDTLAVSGVTSDPDGDEVVLRKIWQVNGTTVGAADRLDGRAWFDKGDRVSVVVTPFDGEHTGTPVAPPAVTVLNTPPTAPVVVVDPADPVEGEDDLWCRVSTPARDDDDDKLTYRVSWTVDGKSFSGAGTRTWAYDYVDAADIVEGERWVCTAVASDGDDTGPAASASATIAGADCTTASASYRITGGTATLPGGTHRYDSFRIDGGARVLVTGSSTLVIIANEVVIAGVLDLSGQDGVDSGISGGPGGGDAGPGGGGGGGGGDCGNGAGRGGSPNGASAIGTYSNGGDGGRAIGTSASVAIGGGFGPGGGGGGGGASAAGSAGVRGGSGGSGFGDALMGTFTGGGGGAGGGANGGGGGGGGGGVRIIADNIAISGTIEARGGDGGGKTGGSCTSGGGGGGGGGMIWLAANDLGVTGLLDAEGGDGHPAVSGVSLNQAGGDGADGRIRLSGARRTVTGTVRPVALQDSTKPACEP